MLIYSISSREKEFNPVWIRGKKMLTQAKLNKRYAIKAKALKKSKKNLKGAWALGSIPSSVPKGIADYAEVKRMPRMNKI